MAVVAETNGRNFYLPNLNNPDAIQIDYKTPYNITNKVNNPFDENQINQDNVGQYVNYLKQRKSELPSLIRMAYNNRYAAYYGRTSLFGKTTEEWKAITDALEKEYSGYVWPDDGNAIQSNTSKYKQNQNNNYSQPMNSPFSLNVKSDGIFNQSPLDQKINNYEEMMNNSISTNNQLTGLNTSLNTLSNTPLPTLAVQNSQIDTNNVSSIEAGIGQNQNNANLIAQYQSVYNNNLSGVNNNINQVAGNITSLQAMANNYRKKIGDLGNRKTYLLTIINNPQVDAVSKQKAQSEIDSIPIQITTAQNMLNYYNGEIQKLQNNVNSFSTNLNTSAINTNNQNINLMAQQGTNDLRVQREQALNLQTQNRNNDRYNQNLNNYNSALSALR